MLILKIKYVAKYSLSPDNVIILINPIVNRQQWGSCTPPLWIDSLTVSYSVTQLKFSDNNVTGESHYLLLRILYNTYLPTAMAPFFFIIHGSHLV